jgi:hypothetical protein
MARTVHSETDESNLTVVTHVGQMQVIQLRTSQVDTPRLVLSSVQYGASCLILCPSVCAIQQDKLNRDESCLCNVKV